MGEYVINSRFARAIEKQYNVTTVSAINFNYVRSIEYKNLPFGGREEKDLERIKVIFPNLEEIKFINIEFNFKEFPRIFIKNLYFENCNIGEISFDNVDILNSITCKSCKIQSLDKFAKMENLKILNLEEEKILAIDNEKLMISVIPNYPRFDFYSKEKQYEILIRENCLVDGFVKLRINNNLKFLNLEEIKLINYDFISSELDNLSKLVNIKDFEIRTNKILDIKFLEKFENVNKISIDLVNKQNLEGINIISNFKFLTELDLSSVLNVSDVLVNDNQNIEVLKIENTEIIESSYISKLKKLRLLHLCNNEIKQNIFELIANYTKDNNIKLIVESEELREKYNKNVLNFKDKNLKNKLKELLKIETEDITEYDLLISNVGINEFNVNIDSFMDIIDLQLYDKLYIKKIILNLEVNDDITEIVEKFSLLDCEIYIKLKNLNSIDLDDITRLRNTKNVIKYKLTDDYLDYDSEMLFFVKTYFKKLATIDKSVNINYLDDKEKFKYFVLGYKNIVNNFVIVDNYQDLEDFKNTVLEEDKQSIYYDILDEKASIMSICNLLSKYCMYFDFEPEIISTTITTTQKYYFVKVKIDNKWYNMDIIADILNSSMDNFLVSEDKFQDLYYDNSFFATEDYNRSVINDIIAKG